MAGLQTGQDLADAYAAMDVFVFSSQSETQGMVLAEAMAAGVPAVALDAPGAREIVNDRNGRLLPGDASDGNLPAQSPSLPATRIDFANLVRRLVIRRASSAWKSAPTACWNYTSGWFANTVTAPAADPGPWDRLLGRLEIEWNLLVEKTAALAAAARETEATKSELGLA